MAHSFSHNELVWGTHRDGTHLELPDTFMSALVAELDSEVVQAIVLVGSYTRGEATAYSDVDLIRLVRETPEPSQQKRYTYRDSRLVGIVTHTIAQYRDWFSLPEHALFVVPSIREARIVLDKDGAFNDLQQEAQAFLWEPLQAAANFYASTILMDYTEYVHKILRALLVQDELALAEMVFDLMFALTDAVTVQRGILAASGNSYFRQVQESVGFDSTWTRYHRLIAGIEAGTIGSVSLQSKGVAALRFYRETVQLLQPALQSIHREVIDQAVAVIQQALSDRV